MIHFILSSMIIAQAAQPSDCELRFTCFDAQRMVEVYNPNYQQIKHYLMRLRELAIQSANGTLSNNDRGYIHAEARAIIDEIDRLIEYTSFEDQFLENHHPLRDGIKFLLSYRSVVSNATLVGEFDFSKISTESLGKLAQKEVKLLDSRVADSSLIEIPRINGIKISAPHRFDDTVSSEGSWRSSIAWARAINSKAGETRVLAEVRSTIQNLSTTSSAFPANFSNVKINGVSLPNSVLQNANELIQTINDFSISTGVKARFLSGSSYMIQLYATDGRNISLNLNGNASAYEVFGRVIPVSGTAVFTGKLRLKSAQPITVVNEAKVLGDEEIYDIPVAEGGLSSLDLSYQVGAMEALNTIDASFPQLTMLEILAHRLRTSCPSASN